MIHDDNINNLFSIMYNYLTLIYNDKDIKIDAKLNIFKKQYKILNV